MWHFTPNKDWNPDRTGPTHLGTQQAALERGFGANFTESNRGTIHKVAINPTLARSGVDVMANTPDMPVTDRMANELFHGDNYSPTEADGPTFDDEVRVRSDMSHSHPDGSADFVGRHVKPDSRYAKPVQGLYYRNGAEDRGSISAVVPRPDWNLRRTQSFRVASPTIETEVVGIDRVPGTDQFATMTSSSVFTYGNPIRKVGSEQAQYPYTNRAEQHRLFPVQASRHQRRALGSPQFERYA